MTERDGGVQTNCVAREGRREASETKRVVDDGGVEDGNWFGMVSASFCLCSCETLYAPPVTPNVGVNSFQ